MSKVKIKNSTINVVMYHYVREIKNSINFFKNLGFDTNSFSVCFPYGSYNRDTINLLKKYNIDFSLTTNADSINNKNIV